MPPGYAARCAACSSPHRPEIDRRLLAGDPTRSVSNWLLEQGERVSHAALGNHKREHLAVAEAIAQRAAEAAPVLEQAVQAGLDDLALLREQVQEAAEIRKLMADIARDRGAKKLAPPMTVVTQYKASADEVRQGIKGIRDILDANGSDDGSDDQTDSLLEAIHAVSREEAEEIARQSNARRTRGTVGADPPGSEGSPT